MPDTATSALGHYLRSLPATLRAALLEAPEIRSVAGLPDHPIFRLGEHRIPLDGLFELGRAVVDGRVPPPLLDVRGGRVEHAASLDGNDLVVRAGTATCIMTMVPLASEHGERRLAALEHQFRMSSLPPGGAAALRAELAASPLSVASYIRLLEAFEAAPERFLERLNMDLRAGRSLGVHDLVPAAKETFVAMAAEREGSLTLREFVAGPLRAAIDAAVSRDPVRALRYLAPIPFSGSSPVEEAAATLPAPTVLRALELIASDRDPFGLLLGLAVCAGRADGGEFGEAGNDLLDRLHGVDGAGESSFGRYSACALAVLGVTGMRRTFAGEPTYYARLVALTCAGHLTRVLAAADVDPESFLSAAIGGAGADALVAGWLERSETPSWRPEWLDPSTFTAHVRAQAHSIVTTMGERAPASWRRRVDEALEAAMTSGELAHRLKPGPLDSFDDRWDGFAVLDTRDVEGVVTALTTPADKAQSFLAIAYLGEVPEDARAVLRRAVEERLRSAATARIAWDEGVDAALHLAGRWGDGPLADLAMEAAVATGAIDRAPSDSAIRAALDVAAAGEADGWRSRLKTAAERLAMADISTEASAALADGITILAPLVDGLEADLAKARMAASTRSGRAGT